MVRPSLKHVAALALVGGSLTACGSQEIDLDTADQANARMQQGAQIFSDRCAGCHTLEAAGAQGSAFKVHDRERVDGPNFDTRPVDKNSVLYAIRNGGFSGAIMPENIVLGEEADVVADFVAKYAGRQAPSTVSPKSGAEPTDTP
jgi:mono/diheme cytochrome c family protein